MIEVRRKIGECLVTYLTPNEYYIPREAWEVIVRAEFAIAAMKAQYPVPIAEPGTQVTTIYQVRESSVEGR